MICIQTSPVVLPDPENMGIGLTDEMSLLSSIWAEIYIISYLLPVHGRHFEFRLQYSSAVITIISCNSAVLKNLRSITVSFTIGDIIMRFHSNIIRKKLLPTSVLEVAI